jgi:hypothetical protein
VGSWQQIQSDFQTVIRKKNSQKKKKTNPTNLIQLPTVGLKKIKKSNLRLYSSIYISHKWSCKNEITTKAQGSKFSGKVGKN